MKTVPGPAAALQACVPILQNPTRQEIERVVKEMRVGNTLEQALVNMSARIGSRTIDSALSSVLIGLQVGGNLPVVLETTAATIREMNRLEGVVRTKTGEGQGAALGARRLPLRDLRRRSTPCSLATSTRSRRRSSATSSSPSRCSFWLGSLLVARKVLTVDI